MSLDATIRSYRSRAGSLLDEEYSDLPGLISDEWPSPAATAAEPTGDSYRYPREIGSATNGSKRKNDADNDNVIWRAPSESKSPDQLVFDPVLGVVPYGVLAAWEKARPPRRRPTLRGVGETDSYFEREGSGVSDDYGGGDECPSRSSAAAVVREAFVEPATKAAGNTGFGFAEQRCNSTSSPPAELKKWRQGTGTAEVAAAAGTKKRSLPPVRGTPEWHAWQAALRTNGSSSLFLSSAGSGCRGNDGKRPAESSSSRQRPSASTGKGRAVGTGGAVVDGGCCGEAAVRATVIVENGIGNHGKVSWGLCGYIAICRTTIMKNLKLFDLYLFTDFLLLVSSSMGTLRYIIRNLKKMILGLIRSGCIRVVRSGIACHGEMNLALYMFLSG